MFGVVQVPVAANSICACAYTGLAAFEAALGFSDGLSVPHVAAADGEAMTSTNTANSESFFIISDLPILAALFDFLGTWTLSQPN